MKKFYNKYIKWGLTALTVLILAVCFVYLMFRGQNLGNGLKTITRITMPVIYGLVIAFIATPVLNKIEQKFICPICKKCKLDTEKLKSKKRIRGISLLLTYFLIGLILYAFFSVVIPQIILSIQTIILQFPTYINNLLSLVEKLLADNPEVEKNLTALLETYSNDLNKWLDDTVLPTINSMIRSVSASVTMSVISLLKTLYNLVIGLIISVYVLAGKEKFASQAKKLCYALLERSKANKVIRGFRFANRTFTGFLGGKIVDSAIIGVLCFFGMSVLQMPYVVLISVIVGVTNIIPFFGPYIGAIPSALLILMIQPVKCIPFILFILILQQLDGNVIGPKILGESTGLTGFWVIFAITFFGGLWGILGMIVGVPLFAVFYAGAKYYVNRFLKKKNLPTDTKDYEKLFFINEKNEFVMLGAGNKPEENPSDVPTGEETKKKTAESDGDVMDKNAKGAEYILKAESDEKESTPVDKQTVTDNIENTDEK